MSTKSIPSFKINIRDEPLFENGPHNVCLCYSTRSPVLLSFLLVIAWSCLGITEKQAMDMATKMGFSDDSRVEAADYITKMYNLFIEKDATLIEINPMCEDSDGRSNYVVQEKPVVIFFA